MALLSHELKNGSLTLVFTGDVLSTSVDLLRLDVQAILADPAVNQAPWSRLHLDLRQTHLLDSSGLCFLTVLVRIAMARRARLSASLVSPAVERVLRFTRLDRHIELQVGSAAQGASPPVLSNRPADASSSLPLPESRQD